MKKTVLAAAFALGAMSMSAQGIEQPKFFDNWSVGLNGGVTTPLSHNPFFKSMRGVAGINVAKQITPVLGIGAEGMAAVNTSNWKGQIHSNTAFDATYVGLYGTVDLFNLFGGYQCATRPFSIDAVGGMGWLHTIRSGAGDLNDFATKAGLNFNFNVNDNLTLRLQPSVMWNMDGRENTSSNSTEFNVNAATFNVMAGVIYNFGGHSFNCVQPYNQAEIDALNAQINDLRLALDASVAATAASQAEAAQLANDLQACMNQPKQVVKETTNNLNSVRYVFFKLGSSVITADQQPNVEMIAAYLKNHKDATVNIKGYASPDGPMDVNVKLAQARAEAVKNALVNKYKIAANRITAEGEGIGKMFSEESWNRVSICTVDASK